MIDGLLFRVYNGKQLFVIPENMVNNIIRIYHDDLGHVGIDKTVYGILGHYWFPCLKMKVREYINNYVKCLTFSMPADKAEGEMQLIVREPLPFSTLHLDHYGPLEATNDDYKHVLIIIDAYTKFVWLFPTKSTGTAEVIDALNILFDLFGLPRQITSDRGTAFSSLIFLQYLRDEEIKHVMVAVASPWANGLVERVNRFLRSTLAKMVDDMTKWKEVLGSVQYVINNSMNKSLNLMPSKMLLGYDQRFKQDENLRTMLNKLREVDVDCDNERTETRDLARTVSRKLQEYNKKRYDKRHKKCTQYKTGDLVMIKVLHHKPGTNQKLMPKFKGPYQIKTVLKNRRFVVTDIPGYNQASRPLNTILSSDKLKRGFGLD